MKKTAKRGKRKPTKKSTGNGDSAASTASQKPSRKDVDAAVRRAARLKATIDDLRNYHKLGLGLVGERRDRLTYGKGLAVAVAKKLGKTRDHVEKACQLARTYDAKSFEILLKHLQATSNKHSFALSLSHVMATLLLRGKGERKTFLTKAAKNTWSTARLRAEIILARSVERKSKGGRKRRLPETREQLLREASNVCRHLIKLRDKIDSHKDELKKKAELKDEVKIWEELDEVWDPLIDFQESCDRLILS